MKKVIIDADTGSDDAVALLMAYRNLAKENILELHWSQEMFLLIRLF